MYSRFSRLISSQLQQAPALIRIQVHKLLARDLRKFEWVPEDRCVEGRLGLEPIPKLQLVHIIMIPIGKLIQGFLCIEILSSLKTKR